MSFIEMNTFNKFIIFCILLVMEGGRWGLKRLRQSSKLWMACRFVYVYNKQCDKLVLMLI